MPASIPLSPNEKKWFLKLIHEVYGIHVVDAYACQRLSEELLTRSKISISYNTIRRLFGIIKGSNQASRFTLDSLSKGLGYADFTDFQVSVNQFEIDYFNQLLILNRLLKRKDNEIILHIIQELQFEQWENAYQLKSIVDLCLEVNNYELLEAIFQLDFDLQKEEIGWKLYVVFQSIFIQAQQGNKELINFVKQLMTCNEMAQRILLQLFVDEESLNGYYGEWIEAASIDLVDDLEMFKNLMLIQRAVLNQQNRLALSLMERCNEILAQNTIFIHPILKGRLAAWNWILLKDANCLNIYFDGLNTVPDQLFCLVFFYRILDDFGQDLTQFDLMERYIFDEKKIAFRFPEKENLNIYYLLRAQYFKQKNNQLEKKIALDKFNPLYKYSCLYDWVDRQLIKLAQVV